MIFRGIEALQKILFSCHIKILFSVWLDDDFISILIQAKSLECCRFYFVQKLLLSFQLYFWRHQIWSLLGSKSVFLKLCEKWAVFFEEFLVNAMCDFWNFSTWLSDEAHNWDKWYCRALTHRQLYFSCMFWFYYFTQINFSIEFFRLHWMICWTLSFFSSSQNSIPCSKSFDHAKICKYFPTQNASAELQTNWLLFEATFLFVFSDYSHWWVSTLIVGFILLFNN